MGEEGGEAASVVAVVGGEDAAEGDLGLLLHLSAPSDCVGRGASSCSLGMLRIRRVG
jgi:hypothetical protein